MHTITIVYDPASCCEGAEPEDDDFDLFHMIEEFLNDAGVKAQINLYERAARPAADEPRMLELLERCRAALPDAWFAVKSNVPRALIDDLNQLLRAHGR